MRDLRHSTVDIAWPSLRHGHGRLLGLPFALAGWAPGIVFGWQGCFAALMVASVASFLVYVPMTALTMNGGRALPEDAPIPPLTVRAYVVLLVLWTVTAWLAAAVPQFSYGGM